MILVVCLNPALDITHHVPAVDWAGVNRPRAVEVRPGGKGVNVARTLLALGAEVQLIGLAGGTTGEAVRARLAELEVPSTLIPVAGETRRTFAVLDQARRTCALFNEPGPTVGAAGFGEFLDLFERSVAGSQAVVLSGSLPPGLPADTYATLIRTAGAARPTLTDNSDSSNPEIPTNTEIPTETRNPTEIENHTETNSPKKTSNPIKTSNPTKISNPTKTSNPTGHIRHSGHSGHGAGVPVVLDAHGDALRLGVAAGPAIVKPNLDELEDLAGQSLSLAGAGTGRPAVASAAADLRAAGAGAVVVSLGPAGLRAVTADGGWQAVPPVVDAVNPTGAGDAVVAALTFGLVTGQPWPDRLRAAAALGTAAALAPVAGEFGPDDYRRIQAGVTVTGGPASRYGSAECAGHDGPAGAGNGGGG